MDERFVYDSLHRLEFWRGNQGTDWNWQVQYQYDDLGNLRERNYTHSTRAPEVLSYTYSGVGAGPDAVTSSDWGSYRYDAKGNRTSNADGSTISYTPFDLPQEVLGTAGQLLARFEYDTAGKRARKTLPAQSKSTVYVDGIFEYRTENGASKLVHYVIADELVAEVITLPDGTEQSANYVHTDLLGSAELMTSRTNGVLSVQGPRTLDPFGNEVDIANPVLHGTGSRKPTPLGSGLELEQERAGTGTPANAVPRGQPGFRERVDFGEVIGDFVKDGTSTPTTKRDHPLREGRHPHCARCTKLIRTSSSVEACCWLPK